MFRLHDFIDVSVRREVAFRQWLAFEEYPTFMEGVHAVDCRDGESLHWLAENCGHLEEWMTEIIDNIPPERLSWESAERKGVITLRGTPWGTTRVFVEMDLDPLEHCPDARHQLDAAMHRLHADLERFKERVEKRRGPERDY